jgi:hypothetical protein
MLQRDSSHTLQPGCVKAGGAGSRKSASAGQRMIVSREAIAVALSGFAFLN